jgi:GMP synthase-like glutamine amidotransferase
MQDHTSTGGLIGDAFSTAGWDVSEMLVVPAERYRSPDVPVMFPSAAEYDAVALFGAVWSAYDTATIPWVTDEIGYARSLISLGVPVLGICFGGQGLATAVGGTVPSRGPSRRSAGSPWLRRTALIDAGRGCSGTTTGSRCPRGACARQTAAANQAFTYGRLGVQFHPGDEAVSSPGWPSTT